MMNKQILTIQSCIITDNDIYNLYQHNENSNLVFELVPKYVINNEYGNIMISEDYLQFIGLTKLEKPSSYYTFNVHSSDPILEYEISQYSFVDLMKLCEIDWRNILKFDDTAPFKYFIKQYIPDAIRLVFDIEYFVSTYTGIKEGDMVIGFDKILEI